MRYLLLSVRLHLFTTSDIIVNLIKLVLNVRISIPGSTFKRRTAKKHPVCEQLKVWAPNIKSQPAGWKYIETGAEAVITSVLASKGLSGYQTNLT